MHLPSLASSTKTSISLSNGYHNRGESHLCFMAYDTPGCVYLHSAFMAYSTLGCRELLMASESTASNFLPLKTVTISGNDYKLDSALFFAQYCLLQSVETSVIS